MSRFHLSLFITIAHIWYTSKCIGQAPIPTAASRLVSPYLGESILRLRVTSRPSHRPRTSAFIADFSERFPSAVSRRSRSRCSQDAVVARRTMRVPVSHEKPKNRDATTENTSVCGSCESRARFVDAWLTNCTQYTRSKVDRADVHRSAFAAPARTAISFRLTDSNWYLV